MENECQYYNEGYFVDYNNGYQDQTYRVEGRDDKYLSIKQVTNRMYPYQKISVESTKLHPFRTKTSAKQDDHSYNRPRNLELQQHNHTLSKLEQISNRQVRQRQTPVQIVQLLKGANFYHFMRLFQISVTSNEEFQVLARYFEVFTKFVTHYLTELSLQDVTDQLYKDQHHAYMLSYPEILMNMSQMMYSHRLNNFIRTNSPYVPSHYFHDKLTEWVNQGIVPALARRGFEHLNLYILQKLLRFFVQLKHIKDIVYSQQLIDVLVTLLDMIMHHLSMENHRLPEFKEIFTSFEPICIILKHRIPNEQIQIYRAKIQLGMLFSKFTTIRYPTEIFQEINTIDKYLNEKNPIIKNILLQCPKFPYFIKKFCELLPQKQNSLSLYMQVLNKLKKQLPDTILKTLLEYRKVDAFKKIDWDFDEFKNAVEIVKANLLFTRQELVLCLDVIQRVNIFRENNLNVLQGYKKMEQSTNDIVCETENSSKISRCEQFAELAGYVISQAQETCIRICQKLIDTEIESVLIIQVQGLILKKNSHFMSKQFELALHDFPTNFFREFYTISQYQRRLQVQLDNRVRSSKAIQCSLLQISNFTEKLCYGLDKINEKILLQKRKQRIKKALLLLNKHDSLSVTPLMVKYLKFAQKSECKDFRIKCTDLVLELVKRLGALETDLQKNFENYHLILQSLSIQNISSLNLYKYLFMNILILEKKLGIASGVQKYLESVYHGLSKLVQKLGARKATLQFLREVILSQENSELRQKLLTQYSKNMINQINFHNKFTLTDSQSDYITKVSEYLALMHHQENYGIIQPYEKVGEIITSLEQTLGRMIVEFSLISSDGKRNIVRFEINKNSTLYYWKCQCQLKLDLQQKVTSLIRDGDPVSDFQLNKSMIMIFKQLSLQILNDNKTIPMKITNQSIIRYEIKVDNSLVRSPRVSVVEQEIFDRISIIFMRLPLTKQIWNNLVMTPKTWQNSPKLMQLKLFFLSNHSSLADPFENQLWKSILNCDLKKSIVLECLLQEQEFDDFNRNELFHFMQRVDTQLSIKNNLNTIALLRKLQVELSKSEAEKILEVLNISSYSSHSLHVLEQNPQFNKLIIVSLRYLQAYAVFDIFDFFLTLKPNYFIDIENTVEIEKYLINLWKKIYRNKTNHQKIHIFNSIIKQYAQKHLQNVQVFLRVLQQSNLQSNKQLYLQIMNGLITEIISNQDGISEQVLKVMLEMLRIFLQNQIMTSLLRHEKFVKFLDRNLFSNMGIEVISVLTYLLDDNVLFNKYVGIFKNELNEPIWNQTELLNQKKQRLKSPFSFVGLRNPHSVCYMNSLLQQFFHIKPFRAALFATQWKINSEPQQDMIYQLKKTFLNLQFRQVDSYINPEFFRAFKNLEGEPTQITVQMDVDQFRNILIERIEDLTIKNQNQTLNFVQKIFNGKQVTTITGEKCQHRSERQQQFSSICLDVKNIRNLGESLKCYFQTEILEGENSYLCEECNKKVRAQKKTEIVQFPQYMTFVLKRFEYVTAYREKINSHFEFPIENFDFSGNFYDLVGVIVHQGMSEAGHYFSLIRIKDSWYEFNDNYVGALDENQVKRLSYGDATQRFNKNAYLLIYKRKAQAQVNGSQPQKMHYEGMEAEIEAIEKQNTLTRKINLLFSHKFYMFIQRVIDRDSPEVYDLLLQYVCLIKSESMNGDIEEFRVLFDALNQNVNGNVIKSNDHLNWIVNFYRSTLTSSLKAGLTEIITKNYNGFDEYIAELLKVSMHALSSNQQSCHFYKLFLSLSKRDEKILSFLIRNFIVARTLKITINGIIDEKSSEYFAMNSPGVGFSNTNIHRRYYDQSELKYHKWKFINLVLQSDHQLSSKQSQLLFYKQNWSKIKVIIEQATTKVNMNEISRFFCNLCKRSDQIAHYYLMQVTGAILKEKSDALRKYLKFASDLLKINDSLKQQRLTQIANAFKKAMKRFYESRVVAGFDICWQWLLKITAKNDQFRYRIYLMNSQFSYITRTAIEMLYSCHNQFFLRSEESLKNRYHGLQFPVNAQHNHQLWHYKLESTKKLFDIDYVTVASGSAWDSDGDITDQPLEKGDKIMKFNIEIGEFRSVRIEQICGDMVEIGSHTFDVGNEKLTKCFGDQEQSDKASAVGSHSNEDRHHII